MSDDAREGVEPLVLPSDLPLAGLPLGDVRDRAEVVRGAVDPVAGSDRRDRDCPPAALVFRFGGAGLAVLEGVPVAVEPVGVDVDGDLRDRGVDQRRPVGVEQVRVRPVDLPVPAVGAVDRDADPDGLDHRLEELRLEFVHDPPPPTPRA